MKFRSYNWHYYLLMPIIALMLKYECVFASIKTEFMTPTCISPYIEYQYKICNPIYVKIDNQTYIIPKGFHTDLASIPRPLWFITSPAESNLMRAAIVHDWFYRMTCDFNRKETDLIFYYMLINDGTSKFKASIIYYAVRLFGRKFYNEDYCE